MDSCTPDLNTLFAQLGEASDDDAIDRFIDAHRPLPNGVLLHEAAFWSPAQARFLREAILEDAAWAPVVDVLNTELHEPPGTPPLDRRTGERRRASR